jgi:DNA-binding protein YbaB
MMKNMGNIGQMMKEAQKLQAKMAKLQEELAEKNAAGSYSCGSQ